MIPIELVQCQGDFQTLYKSKFDKRNLTWVYHKGWTEVDFKPQANIIDVNNESTASTESKAITVYKLNTNFF